MPLERSRASRRALGGRKRRKLGECDPGPLMTPIFRCYRAASEAPAVTLHLDLTASPEFMTSDREEWGGSYTLGSYPLKDWKVLKVKRSKVSSSRSHKQEAAASLQETL